MSDQLHPVQSALTYLKRIQEKTLDAAMLTPHARRICVQYLLMQKEYTSFQIAEILKCHASSVRRMTQQIREQNCHVLDGIDERTIAADVIGDAEILSARLVKKGRERDAWAIRREAIEILQSLGYLKKNLGTLGVKGNLTLTEMLKIASDSSHESPDHNGTGPGLARALTNGAH